MANDGKCRKYIYVCVADTHTLCPSSVDCSHRRPLDYYRCMCKSQLYCEWHFAAPGSDYLLSFRLPCCDTTDCPAKSNEARGCACSDIMNKLANAWSANNKPFKLARDIW